jgi:pyruvate dehydrogenase E1 component
MEERQDEGSALDLENQDWTESLDDVRALRGDRRAVELIAHLGAHAQKLGLSVPPFVNTPYVNTIPLSRQPEYPGDIEMEERIRHVFRWNAMAMVVGANKRNSGLGGHIATYASVATLFEVGLHHVFKGPDHPSGGDHLWFQGHAAPGLYARAFMEGRLSVEQLEKFRRELSGGLSSYPHPYLMPQFWQYPTVSMGLGPIMSAYQARFLQYLNRRGIANTAQSKVWAFLGDGEMDEPESTGVLGFAARERLGNLVWVINCNLQRLDGPVRGNGKVIQEFERLFRGAGWSVIKVLWGRRWDPLFEADRDGLLVDRLNRLLDGEWQKCVVEGGPAIRKIIFGEDPRLERIVEHLSDEELSRLAPGGHDSRKVYAALQAAAAETDRPTVILAQTIKGYGLGSAGEGMNISHQQKKLDEEQLRAFRDRFDISVSEEELENMPFLRFDESSPEVTYVRDRREELGGPLPQRRSQAAALDAPGDDLVREYLAGSDRPATTTAVMVRIISKLLKDPKLGPRIVPIVPDEARTFGMDALFRQIGIYSSVGQLYEPVDASGLLYYREAEDGQMLQEGISEAGATSSFIAAGTSHASVQEQMIPFYFFYSMFGFQRVGDAIWAAQDVRARGFLVGGTSGRTTLNGEGLQHQDGHSHVFASAYPRVMSYDPAFASEVALIVQDGLRRMVQEQEDVIYYLTVTNEAYPQLPLPEGNREGVLKGLYRVEPAPAGPDERPRVQLLGSGAIMTQVLEAQRILAEDWGVAASVWSATSYTELRRDALRVERHNLLHPKARAQTPYVTDCLGEDSGLVVAASDFMRALPDGIAPWVPVPMVCLGTDGLGRSDTRPALRAYFEVDAPHVAWAALVGLYRQGHVTPETLSQAREKLGIDGDKRDPLAD